MYSYCYASSSLTANPVGNAYCRTGGTYTHKTTAAEGGHPPPKDKAVDGPIPQKVQ